MKRLFLLCLISGCGALVPRAGDSCSGGAVCESSSVGLFCESGRYVAIQCRGMGGCGISGGNTVTCALMRAQAGDACLQQNDMQAQCSAADANVELQCVSGVWQSQPCNGCFVQDGKVKCMP